VEYDLVVHRSAEQWMRMANHSSMSGAVSTRVEQRFQAAGRTIERQ